MQILYNSQMRRVKELEEAAASEKRNHEGELQELERQLRNAAEKTTSITTDLQQSEAELIRCRLDLDRTTDELNESRRTIRELGHQKALRDAELLAAQTTAADLRAELTELRRYSATQTIDNLDEQLALLDAKHAAALKELEEKLAITTAKLTAAEAQHEADLLETSRLRDAQEDPSDDSVGPPSVPAPTNPVAALQPHELPLANDVSDETADKVSDINPDLAQLLSLETSDDEIVVSGDVAASNLPSEGNGVATNLFLDEEKYGEERTMLNEVQDAIAEKDELISELRAELDVLAADHRRLLLSVEQARTDAELAQQQAISEARADYNAEMMQLDAQNKATVFQLREELTAVKQQVITVCGEKNKLHRRTVELELAAKELDAGHEIELAALAAHATSLQNTIEETKARADELRAEALAQAVADRETAVRAETAHCKADTDCQLNAQADKHKVALDTAAAAAEERLAEALAALRKSYRLAVNRMVADIQAKLQSFRRETAQRFGSALKHWVEKTSKEINARYAGAIEALLQHAVAVSGEATAQALATEVFSAQGFVVESMGNSTVRTPPLPSTPTVTRPSPVAMMVPPQDKEAVDVAPSPLSDSNAAVRLPTTALLTPLPAQVAAFKRNPGAPGVDEVLTPGSTMLITPSPTPSPKSPNSATQKQPFGSPLSSGSWIVP